MCRTDVEESQNEGQKTNIRYSPRRKKKKNLWEKIIELKDREPPEKTYVQWAQK